MYGLLVNTVLTMQATTDCGATRFVLLTSERPMVYHVYSSTYTAVYGYGNMLKPNPNFAHFGTCSFNRLAHPGCGALAAPSDVLSAIMKEANVSCASI